LLPKLYYCHSGLVKKKPSKKTPNQRNQLKKPNQKSKSTCPKWHFGQVGHGGGVLLTKILDEKNCDFL
jgi:hypothetical protein